MRGNLNQTPLPGIIREFYAERKTGALHFADHPSSRRIFFREGRIVRVESDAESDRFGEMLVESGTVQRVELDAAREIAAREGTSVGGALVKMERLTTDGLKEAEVRRMSGIVHSLIARTAGEFRFEEAQNPAADAETFEISAEQVILDGVRRIEDTALLRTLVGDSRATLRTAPSSALPLFRIKMTPGERSLLEATRARQSFSAGQLLTGSRLSEVDTLRALYALISIGILEVEQTPQAPPTDNLEKSEPGAAAASEPPPKAEARARPAVPAESTPRRLGRFELQRLLEESSTAEVFRGRDPEIDRIVAIKVLRLTPAARDTYLESFQPAVERARQLYHPGIAAVLESGLTEDGRPYLVTEFVQGTTLRDLLPPVPLAMKHALELAAQVLDALAYAHSFGIVHQRVEPGNVLVAKDGRVKVKDFGIPLLPDADVSASLPYLSPEQIAKGKIDARADVFSFGVLCYRMLTGVLPFPEESGHHCRSPSTARTAGPAREARQRVSSASREDHPPLPGEGSPRALRRRRRAQEGSELSRRADARRRESRARAEPEADGARNRAAASACSRRRAAQCLGTAGRASFSTAQDARSVAFPNADRHPRRRSPSPASTEGASPGIGQGLAGGSRGERASAGSAKATAACSGPSRPACLSWLSSAPARHGPSSLARSRHGTICPRLRRATFR